jgi:hypothetical protein
MQPMFSDLASQKFAAGQGSTNKISIQYVQFGFRLPFVSIPFYQTTTEYSPTYSVGITIPLCVSCAYYHLVQGYRVVTYQVKS